MGRDEIKRNISRYHLYTCCKCNKYSTRAFKSSSGDYFVERVPGKSSDARTGVGWALVVVYRDNSYPIRNVSLYTGLLISTLGETATISNFITPAVAPVNARVFTMAINGDTDAMILNGTDFQDLII